MPGKRLPLTEDAKILRLRKAGKTYEQIVKLTGHCYRTVFHVVHGRPKKRKPSRSKKRKPKRKPQQCVDCGTEQGRLIKLGGKLRCVEHAARAALRAKGRTI